MYKITEIIALALVAVLMLTGCGTKPVDAVRNEFTPSKVSETSLKGFAGLKADDCIRERAYSQWARTTMYDEAEQAFATHEDDRINGWQNEYWGKMMLCFSGAVTYTGDLELKKWVLDKAHKFVKDYQTPEGYLSTYADEDSMGSEEHPAFNVWGRKYTFWALVDLYESTGDRACLDAAVKMADHLMAQLDRLGIDINQTGYWHGVSSMSILKPMNELYRITGEQKYLGFSSHIVSLLDAEPFSECTILTNGFREDDIYSWFPEATYWAKAYEIMSCLEGLADYYRLTGDKHVLDGVLAFYGHLTEEEINPLRTAGYFDHFLNASSRANGMTELCDVTHWIRVNRELLLLTGESQYADRIEEAFYNAFMAGVRRDGRWGAHIIRSHGSSHLWAPAQTGMKEHQCCPDNMMRTFFDVAGSVAASGNDGSISVILYSDAETSVDGADISISGGYPWNDGRVCVNIDSKKAGKVRFRVPYWSESISVNGESMKWENGWCEMSLPKGKSTWELRFDMKLRTINFTHELDDIEWYTEQFFETFCGMTPGQKGLTRHSGGLEIMRGPILLAKGKLAGTSREETLLEPSLFGKNPAIEVVDAFLNTENAAAFGSMILTLIDGDLSKRILVAPFASVSDVDDGSNWFSVWF